MISDGTNSRSPIVDFCAVHYDLEGWRAYLTGFVDRGPDYLHTFATPLIACSGADPVAFQATLACDPRAAVELLLSAGGLDMPFEQYAASLRAQGVRHQVLAGGQAPVPGAGNVNDRLATLVAPHSDLLSAWAGLDLRDPAAATSELERCASELGMRGASMAHFLDGVDPNADSCHQLYARAAELDVMLWIHTGMNRASNRDLTSCTWADIDRIAVAHPSLVIIAGHGGWPWLLDGMAVVQRHQNVYLEISAHRPRHMSGAGSGWEPLLFYGRSVARHKVLFGSMSWMQRISIRELADEVLDLGIGQAAERAWLHDNAAKLLCLPTSGGAG